MCFCDATGLAVVWAFLVRMWVGLPVDWFCCVTCIVACLFRGVCLLCWWVVLFWFVCVVMYVNCLVVDFVGCRLCRCWVFAGVLDIVWFWWCWHVA